MMANRKLLQESLATIERLEARLAASEASKHEPLAIIGAGCRFPGGVESLEALWQLVREGRNAVSEVPADRWDVDAYYDPDANAVGKMVTKRGGFLSQVDLFDPQFFGISPREATTLDPQQRLLLETAVEALESAGVDIDRLAGSSTGVFTGITTTDYGQLTQLGGSEHSDVYAATGVAHNAAAGRLAFTFGLQGPCTSIDSACSSSLVAVHLACQSLRTRESDLALAGGVNVILSPDATVLFSRWGMMAPDGHCKTFAATADGFVRSEGCAVIALKRLSDAIAAGDPILAVIRGSASNSDGHSSGLTVPNGLAQQAVIRNALASARLNPGDIDYVEAHGTGTSLGDPIEVEALGAVMGEGRPADRPLLIGSIKTNIGHAEAASGLAGLLKVVMALRQEAIPPHLHFTEPNPQIPWSDLPISVPTTLTPWNRGDRPRRAGVSSFGFSGTNAHIILEEAPPSPPPADRSVATTANATWHLVPLSARDDASIHALAERYANALAADTELSVADVATTTGAGRAHRPRRIAVVTDSAQQLEQDLRSISSGVLPPTAVSGAIPAGARAKIAFLFTGQGAQYAGMGKGLYDSEPVFRATMDRAAEILAPHLELPLLDVLFSSDEHVSNRISETGYTQPALFALEYALTALWASWGITPSIVVGHSVGEYVAACVAGAFSFEEGLLLIAERGRLMQALPAGGGMAAVQTGDDAVAETIASMGLGARLGIAAINAPQQTVVSGDADAVAEFVGALESDGIKVQTLEVSHAFHSHRLDPMLDALERRASAVKHEAPRIALISNITGVPWASGSRPDGRYWRRHAREPVRFAAAIDALRASGATALVEVGPQAPLLALAGQSAPDATWITAASLRKGRPDRREMLSTLGSLYVAGANVKWDAVSSGRRVPLPTYPFQRERHWVAQPSPSRQRPNGSHVHPLLGQRQRSPHAGAQFLAEVSRNLPAPFFTDHVVFGTVLVPGTAYIEMGLAAARTLRARGPVAVRNVVIESPLALEETTRRHLHVSVEPTTADSSTFVVRSTAADAPVDADWTVHARGTLSLDAMPAAPEIPTVADLRERSVTAVDVDGYYRQLDELGLEYGPAFRLVRKLHTGDDGAVGLIEAPPLVDAPTLDDATGWLLHPSILDAAFHLLGANLLAADPADSSGRVYLPIAIEEVRLVAAVPSPARVWATARVRDTTSDPTVRIADLRLEDDAGTLIAIVSGLQLRAVTPATLRRALAVPGITTKSYRLRWAAATAVEPPSKSVAGRIVIVGDRGGFAAGLAQALEEKGASTVLIPAAASAEMTVDALTERLRGSGSDAALPSWVIDCGALDVLDARATDPITSARRDYLRVLRIAQALSAAAPTAGFCLLTRGAQAIAPGDDVDVARATLLGFARSYAAEFGDAPALRLDLDPAAPPDAHVVIRALGLADREPEMGVRSGELLAPRLDDMSDRRGQTRDRSQRDVLRIPERGALEALTLMREPRRTPAADEVEIEVRAAGLNFRDVLNALGMYPGDPGPLGSECSGVVTAVGSEVTELRVGDEVVGFAIDSMASHVTAPAKFVLRKPPNVGFADAVTLPNTYMTAALSLRTGGVSLQPRASGTRQRVLIHAAAGGVGLAALRLARRAGAEVLVTCSSQKRALVLAEGATHAFDSRSASFADDVLEVTDGAGVDFVLNSLSGDLIAAGMRVVADGGAFVEIGKKGIWSPEEAAERAPKVRYHIVDLGVEMQRDTTSMQSQFADLLRDVGSGDLAPLPVRAFPLADAAAAFRHMSTGRHMGKIALMPASGHSDVDGPGAHAIRPDGTYLVTGGLGGLGFATATWLAGRGAGELVLVGRKGPSPADEARLDELRALGAQVIAVGCDIGDRDAVRALWNDVLASRPPLRGIVHAAGALADAPLAQQDESRFETTAKSKIEGPWYLHEQSSSVARVNRRRVQVFPPPGRSSPGRRSSGSRMAA